MYTSIPKSVQNNIKASTPCITCCGRSELNPLSLIVYTPSICNKPINPIINTNKYKNRYTKKLYVPYSETIPDLEKKRNEILLNYNLELQTKFQCNLIQ